MMVVQYSAEGDVFHWEAPEELSEWPISALPAQAVFDVASDGERFLMLMPHEQGEEEDRGPILGILFLNWFEELKRLVPTGR